MSSVHTLRGGFGELYERERSAYRHAMRQAEQLGEVDAREREETGGEGVDGRPPAKPATLPPPAVSLRAVAAHAGESIDAMIRIAKDRDYPGPSVGHFVTATATNALAALLHKVSHHEPSYREILAELHDDLELAREVRALAVRDGDEAIVAFLDAWLPIRSRMLRDATGELDWFVAHPALSFAFT